MGKEVGKLPPFVGNIILYKKKCLNIPPKTIINNKQKQ